MLQHWTFARSQEPIIPILYIVAVGFGKQISITDVLPVSILTLSSVFRNYYSEPVGNVGTCDGPDEINEPYVPEGAYCIPIGSEVESVAENTEPENMDTKNDGSVIFKSNLAAFVVAVVALLGW